MQALKKNCMLKILNLKNINVNGEVAVDLADVIKNNSCLELLVLKNNNLGPSAIMILQALQENHKLMSLNLGGTNMTGQVVENLADVIRCNPNLKDLYLMNSELKSSANLILTALKETGKLKILMMSNCFLAESTRVELASVIKK